MQNPGNWLRTASRFGWIALFIFLFDSFAFAIPSVLTQNYDNMRTGSNTNETILTPGNVKVGAFGKLFTIAVPDIVTGQVLYVPGLTVQNAQHNVIYTTTIYVTGHTSTGLYAFDADTGVQLFQHLFTNPGDGVTCTPVIDPNTNTIYVLTQDNGEINLHALDITTGVEKTGSPMFVEAFASGSGAGSVNGKVRTLPFQSSRPALLLLNGNIYLALSMEGDAGNYHGWVIGYRYDGMQFTQTGVFCDTPNGIAGGIWQLGQGLAADANGFLYCATGNGTFDANAGGIDYSMCYLKLNTPNLSVADYFAPHDEAASSSFDGDLAGGGVAILPGTNRLFGGVTKFHSVFLTDTSNMGIFHSAADNVLNRIDNICNTFVNPVIWDSGSAKYVYLLPAYVGLLQLRYDPAVGKINPAGVFKQNSNGPEDGTMTVSSHGFSNGILWAMSHDRVRAFPANDVSSSELWDSEQNATRDHLDSFPGKSWPMVVNGKLYVPNGVGKISVFGLLPNQLAAPAGLTATDGNAQVSLVWNASAGATSYHVKQSTVSGGAYALVSSPTTTSYVDTGLTNGTTYYYVVSAVSADRESPDSAQASATPAAVPVVTTITVAPTSATVFPGGEQQFTAIAQDQNGLTMSPQPAFTWAVSGGGAINASTGLFTAGGSADGPFTVTAASGSISGTAQVTVVKPVAIVDFNGDGKADLVLQNSSTNQVALWYMNGATVAGGGYLSAIPSAGWNVVGTGDFNGDGKPDLVMQNTATNKVAIWYLNGTTLTGGAYVSTIPAAGWVVFGIGDFNGDGKPDLALQNTTTRKIALWYLNGVTVSGGVYASATPTSGWTAVGVGDFNGDGKPDIVLQNALSRQIGFWYLIGMTVTHADTVSSIPPVGWSVTANGDFNHDGKLDLVLQDSATRKAALWYFNGPAVVGGAYTSVTPGAGWRVVGPD